MWSVIVTKKIFKHQNIDNMLPLFGERIRSRLATGVSHRIKRAEFRFIIR